MIMSFFIAVGYRYVAIHALPAVAEDRLQSFDTLVSLLYCLLILCIVSSMLMSLSVTGFVGSIPYHWISGVGSEHHALPSDGLAAEVNRRRGNRRDIAVHKKGSRQC